VVMREKYKINKGLVRCQAPSNIAFVKYWGKKGHQLPMNPSLSMALNKSFTQTAIEFGFSKQPEIKYSFNGSIHPAFQDRVAKFIASIKDEIPWANDFAFDISSHNTFPHSVGIASSASAFGALALGLCKIEELIFGKTMERAAFFNRASMLARLGSGSACRSVFTPFAIWGKNDNDPASTDVRAIAPSIPVHPFFLGLKDAILIVSSDKKDVSSSAGHELMNGHPYAGARTEQAHNNLDSILRAMRENDQKTFLKILEEEAMSLHALMMASRPSYILLKANSLKIIEEIRVFREKEHIFIGFTIDAGPNIHMVYHENDSERIQAFIDGELLAYCENGQWIDDGLGSWDGKYFIE
jgi:diphosphomevalonate decarboxylase